MGKALADATRRLSAIVAIDVAGYSRMMGEDEQGTLSRLKAYRATTFPIGEQHGGRIVGRAGDGELWEFPSVVDAVKTAIAFQKAVAELNINIPDNQRMLFRIGVNLGDVLVDGNDIYGDGVNVAARLEALAEPGGICVSLNVRDQIRDRLPVTLADRGDIKVKNIARPVRVFAVETDGSTDRKDKETRPTRKTLIRAILTATIAMALGVLIWALWPADILPVSATDVRREGGEPSVVVLPFENLSNQSDQDYFADGLADDLITDLSKISGLLVISRNSSFAYRGQATTPKDVALELGVRFVLEGSVRRASSSLRINVRLIDGDTGKLVWADRFEREYKDVFAIQDEVIRGVVDALSLQLSDEQQVELAALPTNNLEAYDYYLRAEKLAYRAESGSVAKALALYQRSIALDGTFANAYAGYARVVVDVLSYGFFDSLPSAVARKRAYEAASKAADLNPRLPRSYSVLALLQMLDGEHDTAIASARKAVELAPNDSDALLNLAVVLIYAGQHEEALTEFRNVYRLNPKAPDHVHDYHAMALYILGKDQEALDALGRSNPAIASDLRLEILAGANARLGKMTVAHGLIDEVLRRLPEANIAGFRIVFQHHAQAADLNARVEAFRLAGLPEWPMGFDGKESERLDASELEGLIEASVWQGERVGVGPFIRQYTADGGFVERGQNYQISGTAFLDGDSLCMRSPSIYMERKVCGGIYRWASDQPTEVEAYAYPNPFSLYRFKISR